MILLITFAFIAGIVTILSPCILPILPIVLSGGLTNDKKRPIGIILGFIISFTFFTLFLSSIVGLLGIPADTLRISSILIVGLFGLGLMLPQMQKKLESVFSKLSTIIPSSGQHKGFFGGIIIGLSIGLLWTPCVGPILASVISLALSGSVTGEAFFITLSYSLGTAIPMFFIMMTGRALFQKAPWLLSKTSAIQKAFGVVMLFTALSIFLNFDRKFQTFILNIFPKYGTGLTKFEDSAFKNISLNPLSLDDLDKEEDLLPKYAAAPEIIPGGQWFNSEPLTVASLRGKVILVDFWTYTCINCQRTLPYLREWYGKYSKDGLVIIGVHTPEFEFEKSASNLQEAIEDFQLTYPIVQDNNYSTWTAYNNHYWPAKYIIDKDGIIRYFHFGEGKYDETEKMIQKLLEIDQSSLPEIKNPSYQVQATTPESYLGYSRIESLTSPETIEKDKMRNYTFSSSQPRSTFSFQGKWMVGDEYAAPQKGSHLRIHFESKDVYLVMRPKGSAFGVIKVLLDGESLSENAGQDVVNGKISVDKDRLYKLIHLDSPKSGILELEFLDENVELYAFTFG